MHLADEVRLGADPLVCRRGQLLGARADRLDHPGGDEGRVGRPGGRLQLVRDHPGPADRDLEGRAARVRDRERRPAELADDAEVGGEAVLLEQPAQVLAAAARRLVQPDRDDHELAGERRLTLGDDPHRLRGACERALHVRRAAADDRLAVEPGRLVRDRDGVEVAVENDRRPGAVAAQPPDHDRRLRKRLDEQLDLHPALARAAARRGVRPRRCRRSGSRPDELQGQVAQPIGLDVLGHRRSSGSVSVESTALRAVEVIFPQCVVERLIERQRPSFFPRLGECFRIECGAEPGHVRCRVGPADFTGVEAHRLAKDARGSVQPHSADRMILGDGEPSVHLEIRREPKPLATFPLDRNAFRQQQPCGVMVARFLCQQRKVRERVSDAPRLAELASDGQALLEIGARPFVVAPRQCNRAESP